MQAGQNLGDDFISSTISIFARASQEKPALGVPIFYRDAESGIVIMERPDGSKFEIRFLENAPVEHHDEIIRQLNRTAA